MSAHEFRGSEPMVARPPLRPGMQVPEAGWYYCAHCQRPDEAMRLLMEADQALPLCHTCGEVAEWRPAPHT